MPRAVKPLKWLVADLLASRVDELVSLALPPAATSTRASPFPARSPPVGPGAATSGGGGGGTFFLARSAQLLGFWGGGAAAKGRYALDRVLDFIAEEEALKERQEKARLEAEALRR